MCDEMGSTSGREGDHTSDVASRLVMVVDVFLLGKARSGVSDRRLRVISDRPFERAD